MRSSQENNAWGSHINNVCYQGKLLDSYIETNSKESNQKLFWMQKILCHTFRYTTTRHFSIRTTGTRPFQVSPIMYRSTKRGEKKAYILLFTCSLTRAIHLKLLPYETADEFIRALKRLIARRRCPETIYSDNAKTYVVNSKWIKKINKSANLHLLHCTRCIKWKFNLSRAPC